MEDVMGEAKNGQASAQESGGGGTRDDDIAVIREQTRETVALLRQLTEMLLPKGDPNAPKLEDLIAALVTQQREMLRWVKQVAADQTVLMEHVMGEDRPPAAHSMPFRCRRPHTRYRRRPS